MFYVLVIFIIGVLVLYIDLNLFLMEVMNIGVSFFMFVFKYVGFVFVVGLMNVVILMVVLLVGNLGMYVFMWMFYNLVIEGCVLCIFV